MERLFGIKDAVLHWWSLAVQGGEILLLVVGLAFLVIVGIHGGYLGFVGLRAIVLHILSTS